MKSMLEAQESLRPVTLHLGFDIYQDMDMTPWFSYSVVLPKLPLPVQSERPRIETERLIIRPITEDDLDAFHELRELPELQNESKIRGRPNTDKATTQQDIKALERDTDEHWHFGAFLRSTGEMIGEGGLLDCLHMVSSGSGWPEAEFFIKPSYWRQGYGTEFCKAWMESWWDLPRERKRHQILPAMAPGRDAGDDLGEGLVFKWEVHNVAARHFFAKIVSQTPVMVDGDYESMDTRPGREGNIVKWAGACIVNKRPLPPMPQEEDDDDDADGLEE